MNIRIRWANPPGIGVDVEAVCDSLREHPRKWRSCASSLFFGESVHLYAGSGGFVTLNNVRLTRQEIAAIAVAIRSRTAALIREEETPK